MSIEAYEVYYSTGGKTDRMTVLRKFGESLEEAIARKDTDFSTDSRWCRIDREKKIPLSTVKISDLSITEFKMIMKD